MAAAVAATMPHAAAQVRSRPAREVVVSAAVSLTEVLHQVATIYQAKTGERVVLNLGASNTLARQIAFGAGVDLFISADEAQMNVVAAQVDSNSRVDLLSNQLAIAVPDDRPRSMASARDLLDPAIRRIAIGDGCPGGCAFRARSLGLLVVGGSGASGCPLRTGSSGART